MAKPKKLKVFRTAIGFHDAYVAAPSQKAALEAWGTDTNLFAHGAAEQVTDPELLKEPLEHPGEVIKRLRGSEREQIAALGKAKVARSKKKAAARAKPNKAKPAPKPPKPGRARLDEAEERLDKLEKRQRSALEKLERDFERLERSRRDLLRRHESERAELIAERDQARAAYERAMRKWAKA
jgi:hypothetical protein